MPEISFHGGGRLWFDEIPDQFQHTPLNVLSFMLEAASVRYALHQRLCFRISRIMAYGALGFEFMPHDTGILSIDVYVTNTEDDWENHGLTSVHAPYVLEHAKTLLMKNNIFGSGHLVFKYAGEHPIDSNPRLFKLLTQILFTLAIRDLNSFTDEERLSFISNEGKRYNSEYGFFF
jgi:hypothetical protein